MPGGAEPRIDLGRLPAPAGALFGLAGDLAEERGERLAWVGGGVRDHLLDRTSLDLDFVLEGDLEGFAPALAARLGARTTAHPRFITTTLALADGRRLDLVRARRERYPAPAALPEVEVASLREDLARRDFAVNAIAVRLAPRQRRGEIVDPFGGRDDLAAAQLRVLHGRSFEDDPTRLLRGLRFGLRFGFRFDPETATLARAAVAGRACAALSGARLARELRLLFVDRPEVDQAIAAFAQWGLPAAFAPELLDGEAVARAASLARRLRATATRLQPEGEPVDRWRLGLLALAVPLEAGARRRLASRLALDGGDRSLVVAGPERAGVVASRLRSAGLRPHEADALLAPSSPEELLLIATEGDATEGWVRRYRSEMSRLRPRLSAGDLIAAGVAPGPALGEALRALREARLDGEIGPDAELGFALDWLARTVRR